MNKKPTKISYRYIAMTLIGMLGCIHGLSNPKSLIAAIMVLIGVVGGFLCICESLWIAKKR